MRRINEDAAKSLAEGINGLESILALVEQRVGKVDRWTASD